LWRMVVSCQNKLRTKRCKVQGDTYKVHGAGYQGGLATGPRGGPTPTSQLKSRLLSDLRSPAGTDSGTGEDRRRNQRSQVWTGVPSPSCGRTAEPCGDRLRPLCLLFELGVEKSIVVFAPPFTPAGGRSGSCENRLRAGRACHGIELDRRVA
jgi:hypothetical protein